MKKKIKALIIILILILLFLILRTTYSKYVSEASGDAVAQIGVWEIFVNGEDIAKDGGSNVRFTINDRNVSWSGRDETNVRTGKVAPGMEGTYKIKIDPQHTDTSLKYFLELDASSLKDTNLEITNITLEGGKDFESVENLDSLENSNKFLDVKNDGNDKYKVTRKKILNEEIKNRDGDPFDDSKRIDTIIISIKWKTAPEGSTESEKKEYDRRDTLLASRVYGVDERKLGDLPVKLNVIQYMGE